MTKEIPITSLQKRPTRPDAAPNGRIVRLYGLQAPDGRIQILRASEGPAPSDAVGLREARRILGLSLRQLAYLCGAGHFRTARKGVGKTSPWTISVGELIERADFATSRGFPFQTRFIGRRQQQAAPAVEAGMRNPARRRRRER